MILNNSYHTTGNRCFAVQDITLAWPMQGKTKSYPGNLLPEKTSKEEHGWLIHFFSIIIFQRMRGFF